MMKISSNYFYFKESKNYFPFWITEHRIIKSQYFKILKTYNFLSEIMLYYSFGYYKNFAFEINWKSFLYKNFNATLFFIKSCVYTQVIIFVISSLKSCKP